MGMTMRGDDPTSAGGPAAGTWRPDPERPRWRVMRPKSRLACTLLSNDGSEQEGADAVHHPSIDATATMSGRRAAYLVVIGLALVAAANLAQFPAIESDVPRTWQAVSRSATRDLPAVALHRDEHGIVAPEFGLSFALAEVAPGATLVVPGWLGLEGPFRPELLYGLGQVDDLVVQELGVPPGADLPSSPVLAEGVLTAERVPFVILSYGGPKRSLVMVDSRAQDGMVRFVGRELLPEFEPVDPTR
jgi:hypothetical protein